eukprot:COSAG03_NODE_1591_length_3822_cov_11.092130_4_plen_162_part_00
MLYYESQMSGKGKRTLLEWSLALVGSGSRPAVPPASPSDSGALLLKNSSSRPRRDEDETRWTMLPPPRPAPSARLVGMPEGMTCRPSSSISSAFWLRSPLSSACSSASVAEVAGSEDKVNPALGARPPADPLPELGVTGCMSRICCCSLSTCSPRGIVGLV